MKTKLSDQTKAQILVADDHPLFRDGVVQLINRQPDLACCAQVCDSTTIFETVSQLKPDLLLLDLRMGTEDGLEMVKSLKVSFSALKILVLSLFDEAIYAERTLRAGAMGYVMKDQATEELLAAIRSVLAGEVYVSRKMAASLVRSTHQPTSRPGRTGIESLSDREVQVLQRLGSGRGTRQIADELKLSHQTVETYRENIKHKLDLATAQELVRYATEWVQGQVPPTQPHQ